LSLAAGQCVPWHYHSEISDSFVCLEGPMVVETRAPRHVYRLVPASAAQYRLVIVIRP
jgi:quercetin dioxygenase-like cupin family protein